VGQSLGVGYW